MNNKLAIIVVFLLIVAISVWTWIVAPQLTKLPNNFYYQADIISLDNFYDEAKHGFSGDKRSVTKFSYEVIEQNQGVLIIKNIFDVHKLTGEKIFSVERLYGIDPKTGRHVEGYGDHDREGYLFAPQHLKRGESFTYWHINYDGPARMTFVGEEYINGLPVYRYETRYEGIKIDQTKNLEYLPGVGVTRGVELETYLQLWIEPVTGRMVKYEDDSVAYYYDLKTGERLNPWNSFSNTYKSESILKQAEVLKQEKFNSIIIDFIVPLLFALPSLMCIMFVYRKNKAVKRVTL